MKRKWDGTRIDTMIVVSVVKCDKFRSQ